MDKIFELQREQQLRNQEAMEKRQQSALSRSEKNMTVQDYFDPSLLKTTADTLSDLHREYTRVMSDEYTEMNKWEKSRWGSHRQKEMDQLSFQYSLQDRFHAPGRVMMDQVCTDLAKLGILYKEPSTKEGDSGPDVSRTELVKSYTRLISRQEEVTGADGKTELQLTPQPIELQGLCSQNKMSQPLASAIALLERVQQTAPGEIQQANCHELGQAYAALGLEVRGVGAKYLDRAGEADPGTFYMLLHCSLLTAIDHELQKMKVGDVNTQLVAQVHGAATALGLLCSTLVLTRDFQDTYEANDRSLREEKNQRVEKINREAIHQYLLTGLSSEGDPIPDWPLAEYADLLTPILDEKYKGNHYTWQQIAKDIELMKQNLEDRNQPLLDQTSKKLRLQLPEVRSLFLNWAKEKLGTNMVLRALTPEEMGQLLQDFEQENETALSPLDRRWSKLLEYDSINELTALLQQRRTEPVDLLKIQGSEPLLALLREEDEEQFSKNADALDAQITGNLEQIRSLLNDLVSPTAFHSAMAGFVRFAQWGVIGGTPQSLSSLVRHYVQNLAVFDHNTNQLEADFRKLMSDAGLDACWHDLANQQVRALEKQPPSPDEIKSCLSKLSSLLRANETVFTDTVKGKTYTEDAWEQIDIWFDQNRTLDTDQLSQALNEYLSRIETYSGQETMTREAYRESLGAAPVTRPVIPDSFARKQIKGQALCGWVGFGSVFDQDAEAVTSAVERILQDGKCPLLPEKVRDKVRSVDGLDTLDRQTLSAFLTALRQNLIKVLEPWQGYRCAYPKDRERFLADILLGNVNAENFEHKARKLAEERLNDIRSGQARFNLMLHGPIPKKGGMNYRYLDAVKGRVVFADSNRTERRDTRFSKADQARELFSEAGLDQEFNDCLLGSQNAAALSGRLKDLIQAHTKPLQDAEQGYQDAQKTIQVHTAAVEKRNSKIETEQSHVAEFERSYNFYVQKSHQDWVRLNQLTEENAARAGTIQELESQLKLEEQKAKEDKKNVDHSTALQTIQDKLSAEKKLYSKNKSKLKTLTKAQEALTKQVEKAKTILDSSQEKLKRYLAETKADQAAIDAASKIVTAYKSKKPETKKQQEQLKKLSDFWADQGLDDCANELLLSDYVDALFADTTQVEREIQRQNRERAANEPPLTYTGSPLAQSLARENIAAYNRRLANAADTIYKRRLELEATLATLDLKEDQIKELRIRLRPLVAGLEPISSLYTDADRIQSEKILKEAPPKSKEAQHAQEVLSAIREAQDQLPGIQQANILRFGVASWAEALNMLKPMLKDNLAYMETSPEGAKMLQNRIDQVRSMGGGAMAPAMEYIMQTPSLWRTMTTGTDQEFKELREGPLAAIQKPLELLQKDFPYGSFITRQILLDHWKLIASGESRPEQVWRDLFYNKYVEITRHKAAGDSIEERFQKVVEGKYDQAVSKYLVRMMLSDGMELLLSDKRLNDAIVTHRDNIIQNEQAAEAFLDQKFGHSQAASGVEDNALEQGISQIQTMQKAKKQSKDGKKDPAPADNKEIAARTGFLLYIQKQIPYTDQNTFHDKLATWYQEFEDLQKRDQAVVEQSHQVMDQMAAAMTRIEAKKEEGRDRDLQDQQLIDQLNHGGSPLYQARKSQLNRDERKNTKLPPSSKEIRKTMDAIDDKFKDYPLSVRNVLVEHALVANKSALSLSLFKVKTEVADDSAEAKALLPAQLLQQRYDQILNLSSELELNDSAQEAFFQFLYAREGLVALSDDQLRDQGKEYQKRRRLLAQVNEVYITDPVLELERTHTAEALTAAMFSMEWDQYQQFQSRRLNYLKAAAVADPILEQIIREHLEQHPGGSAPHLKMGLMDYYHSLFLQGLDNLDTEAFGQEVRELLQDRNAVRYLADSTQLMQGVGFTDLHPSEVTTATLADRKGLEAFLGQYASDDQMAQYNALTVDERKVFAIALTIPGGISGQELLPSQKLFQDSREEQSRTMLMRGELQSFINQQDFQPQINYTLALDRLMVRENKFLSSSIKISLESDVFQQALDFTQMCILNRQKSVPEDRSILNDALTSRKEAMKLLGKQEKDSDRRIAADLKQFKKQLRSLDRTKDPKSGHYHIPSLASKLHKRMHNMPDAKWDLLILALNDRTMLDYSTAVNAWGRAHGSIQEHVDPEQRQDFISTYARDQARFYKEFPVDANSIQTAMDTLRGYQLKDSVVLDPKHLTKDDFQNINRKTEVDWGLLERALDLVDEAIYAQQRLEAIHQANDLIRDSGNQKAIAVFEQVDRSRVAESPELGMADFETFLLTQAEKDGTMSMLLGYRLLSNEEKILFIKALNDRSILDVSKENIWLNRFGRMERDYVDPAGRDALIEDYITNRKNGQSLTPEECKTAIISTLSTQVRDAQDYDKTKDMSKELTSRSHWLKQPRSTAVDWKLVRRAIQLVQRTRNEVEIMEQDRAFYNSYGDISVNGSFQFDGKFMRKNVHNAGWRFSRFLARRTAARLDKLIPGPLKTMAMMLMPVETANCINRQSGAQEYEEPGAIKLGLRYFGMAYSSYKANKEAKDSSLSEAEPVLQTDEETELAKKSYRRNQVSAKEAQSKAYSRLNDELISFIAGKMTEDEEEAKEETTKKKTVGEQVKDAAVDLVKDKWKEYLDGFDPATILAEEVVELVNFIRSYCSDLKNVKNYFEGTGEYQELKELYDASPLKDKKLDTGSTLKLMREAKGFENMTELSSFVGMNIVRSLLFSAGKYNPAPDTKTRAIGVLYVLGLKECVGLQDSATAELVYSKIMGTAYR